MRTYILFLVLLLGIAGQISAQCQIITLPYGIVQTDINRGYKIIPTQDGNFVIAGEWNNEAFLLKVNAQGQQLALKKFGADITGTSFFRDVVEAPDGGFVAVGECLNCVVPNDALAKVVVIKTDAGLNLDLATGIKKLGQVTVGGFTTQAERTSPAILRTGNEYLLASSISTGAGLNPQDLLITSLSASLNPVWDKLHHTGFFETPYDLAAGTDGFFLTINRAFASEAILLKVNTAGDKVWQKPVAANLLRGITYLPDSNEVVVIGDFTPSGQDQQAMLRRFDADAGDSLDMLLFGDLLTDEGHDVQLLPNGDLLAGIIANRPNPFGTYASSRIYRIHTNPLSVNCYYLIPNPDNITNMAVRSIVPLSENGKDFAATGIRGFYNRTFFHTRRDCEVTALAVALCPGETHTLPNGQIVSTAGTYPVTLTAVNGCDSLVQTTVSVFAAIPPTQIVVALCPGETYILPNGQPVSTAGTYPVTLTAANGCDSLVQTTVSVFAAITVGNVEINTDNGQGTGSIQLENVQGGSGGTYQFEWSNGFVTPVVENLPGGIYQVTITDGGGCTAVFEYAVMTVSLSEAANRAALQVGPNPFADQIRVLLLLKNMTSARFEIRLVNVYGQVCRLLSVYPGSLESMDGSDLPAGLYFLQLLENGRPVQVRKLIK